MCSFLINCRKYDQQIENFYVISQPHKIVKHTQTICPRQLTNCVKFFDHFVGLALKTSFPTRNTVVGFHHRKPPTSRE